MGATEFFTSAAGATVAEAFSSAVSSAEYESGHGGYTGTIAEKSDYQSASSQTFENVNEARDFANQKLGDSNHWCNDKWGPAAYVTYKNKNGETRFLFFGVASD